MTAGQGGPGRQGWEQPPPGHGPPGWGPPPPGWQPPPGWGPPPAPMPRPESVRIGIGAFMATLILGLISAVVQFSDPDHLIDEVRTQDPSITEDVARAALTVGIVFGLLLVVLQALFIWFAWRGRNWARIILFVLGGLGVFGGLAGLAGTGATNASGFLTSLGVFSLVLSIVGIVALALVPSAEWYRHEGRRRSLTR